MLYTSVRTLTVQNNQSGILARSSTTLLKKVTDYVPPHQANQPAESRKHPYLRASTHVHGPKHDSSQEKGKDESQIVEQVQGGVFLVPSEFFLRGRPGKQC